MSLWQGKRQEARVKRVWAILHFFTQFGFIVFTYLSCLKSNNIDLGNIQFHIIVQNRCFDTWCLGNKGIYPFQPEISPLLDYTNYYDVSINCPEIMGKQNFNTHAQFHKDYLKELFKINNLKHYKITNEVMKEEYLEQLIARVQNETEHLPTFQTFIEFCNMIKSRL